MSGFQAFLNSLSPQEQWIFYAVVVIILVMIVWAIIKKLFKIALTIALILAVIYFVLLYFGQDIAAQILKQRALQTVETIKQKTPEVIEQVKNSDVVKQTTNTVKDSVRQQINQQVNELLR